MTRRSFALIGLLFGIIFLTTSFISPPENPIVVIETQWGKIKIKLYNETPLHRDNFIKLASEGYFDDLLFHRVIKDFMVQGGDPDSRNAQPGVMLGNGGPGYTIPAEFNPKLIHKKGTLCAARESDVVNPKKESSGSQFYLVQGKVFTNEELDQLELRKNQNLKNQIMGEIIFDPKNTALKNRVDSLQKTGNTAGLTQLIKEYDPILNEELKKRGPFKFTEEQRKVYTTIGGTPHLDGSYTVFGEITEGFSVIDSIIAQKTDKNDRPLKDIKMKVTIQK